MATFAEILKQALARKGMNVPQLAEKTGISRNTLYSYLRRGTKKADPDVLAKIAAALDLNPWQLIDYGYQYKVKEDGEHLAMKWYRLAAEQGDKTLQNDVGSDYSDNYYTHVGITADSSRYYDHDSGEHYYDDHAVQAEGTILASPEYQAKKYREEMELKRLERSSGHITQEELELIKLFRATDAKGKETIKNIAQMVNERAIAKEDKPTEMK